jgi:hypothetical protein
MLLAESSPNYLPEVKNKKLCRLPRLAHGSDTPKVDTQQFQYIYI